MNEELYQLIDGELPDDASADLFRDLANSPEQRASFRQQMKLQNALHRNECYQTLTSGEDVDILSRLGPQIGLTAGNTIRWFRGRALAVLVTTLLIGTCIGFLAERRIQPNDQFWPQDAIRQGALQPTLSAATLPAFDRDSVVNALRDSIAQAMTEQQQEQQPTKRLHSRRKSKFNPGPGP